MPLLEASMPEKTIQLVKIMIESERKLQTNFKSTVVSLCDKALREVQQLLEDNSKSKYKNLKKKYVEIRTDMTDCLQITNSHAGDLLFWRENT